MKIGILPIGQIAPRVLFELGHGLANVFPDTVASVLKEVLPIPESSYDRKRKQYNSSLILATIRSFAAKKREFDRFLGVVEVDIFSSGLNYVFGEAFAPGPVGLISLCRLKPQFYSESSNEYVFMWRVMKEAVHEIGHTLGLQHCPRSLCVMHFSNSIFDTDRKQSLLCGQCYFQAAIAVGNLG